jgi:hypothetical protein
VSPMITPLLTALCERQCLKCGKCVPWLPLNYDDIIQYPSILGYMSFWEKKDVTWC